MSEQRRGKLNVETGWAVEAIGAHGFEEWAIRGPDGKQRARFRSASVMAEHFAMLAAEIDRLREREAELLVALRDILPLAEAYLSGAPSHPDNAKLEDARAALAQSEGQ